MPTGEWWLIYLPQGKKWCLLIITLFVLSCWKQVFVCVYLCCQNCRNCDLMWFSVSMIMICSWIILGAELLQVSASHNSVCDQHATCNWSRLCMTWFWKCLFLFLFNKKWGKGGELINLNLLIRPTRIILERNPTFFSILSLPYCTVLPSPNILLVSFIIGTVPCFNACIFLYLSLLFDEAIFKLFLYSLLLYYQVKKEI